MNLTPWFTKGGRSLRARALWAAPFALIALLLRLVVPAPPPRSAEGVAAMLGAAVGGEVRPDDFIWEERGGFLTDAFLGRRVLFLARRGAAGGEVGDLYRARVRLTRAGRPVSLQMVRNLTDSPLGDDRDLVAHGHYAAFVTMGYGVVQGITLLDLDGEGDAREAKTRSERIGAAIESWFASGSLRGMGRTEISFAPPGKPGSATALPGEAKVELSEDLLVIALGKEALPAALDLRAGSLNTGPQNAFAARAQRIPHLRRPLAEVAEVALLREAWGTLPARALRAVVGVPRRNAPRGAPVVFPGREPPPPTPSVQEWPPPALSPQIQPPLAGEGVWAPPAPAFAGASAGAGAGAGGDVPPAFFETAIRPDPRRPEALVRLLAIDLRQMDLRLEAGFDSPRPLTGIRGSGRLPADEPVVAAFTAGPIQPDARPSGATAKGFMAERRIFVPPDEGVATVALHRDGHPALGAWPFGAEPPVDIASLVQAPDPLLGGGAAKIPLAASNAPAERSALCQLSSGQMIYAWAADLDAGALSSALSMAGCVYAVHLAASPAPTGFAYLRGKTGQEPDRWEVSLLAPEMSLSPEQLNGASSNPFFYAVRRDPRPVAPVPAGEARPAGAEDAPAAGWAPDAGQQPTPAWFPAIYRAVVSNLGAQVRLTSFAPGRLVFRLRAGGKEPATKAAAALPGALAEADVGKMLAAIGVGAGRRKGARGLAIEGAVGYPFRGDTAAGMLVIDKGRPEIVQGAGFTLPPGADATEVPLTADEGKLRPEARAVGSMRPRAAACLLADGTFVVGSTTFDSDEAATVTLLDLGCTRVVALDRGAHSSAFLHRAGTETPPSAHYEASAIYAIDAPMTGRAKRLGSAGSD